MKTFLMLCVLISAFNSAIAAQETAGPGSDYLALSEPAFNGNLAAVQEQLARGIAAAAEGQLEVVRLLLVYGAAPEIIDRDGDTARSFALEKGHSAVIQLLDNPPVQASSP